MTDSQRRPPIPFKDIHEAAVPYIEALCKRWLPDGKRSGAWWTCSVPWRRDVTPSLIVSMTTGRWKDCATDDRGDVIDLYRRIYGKTPVEAAMDVARVVGHVFGNAA